MLATDTLLFVHMPKTGGIWVADVLRRLAGAQPVPGTQRHTSVHEIPEGALGDRHTFGTLRDPWSWYASMWQHLRNGVDGPPILRALGSGQEDFPSVLRGMTDPQIWGAVPESLRGGWPWPAPRNMGLYSAVLEMMFGSPVEVHILIDMRHLYEGLSSLLGVLVSPERFPPRNTSQDRPATAVACPGGLYGASELRLVEEADWEVSWVLGYEEPFKSLDPPLMEIRCRG